MSKPWVKKRMKAMRFNIINLPDRIVGHSRCLMVRLYKGHPSYNMLTEIRRRIGEFIDPPTHQKRK